MKCSSLSVSWDHLLRNLFSNLLLWGSVCLCHWGAFPVCSRMYKECLSLSLRCLSCMQQNAGSCLRIQSVSLCLFIRELSSLMLRDIKEKWLLLPVIFVVRGRIMFVWLSSFGFVERLLSCFFLGCSFPSCVGVFHPLSFVGLDLWKDIV